MAEVLLVLIVMLLMAYGLYLLFKPKRWAIPNFPFPEPWQKVLNDKVLFYRSLSEEGKEHFEYKVQEFLLNVKVRGSFVEVKAEDKVLVAASAIIPVFKFPNWTYSNLSEVILLPDRFNYDFEHTGDEKDRRILGMVGTGPMDGLMVLSKPALHHGFSNDTDKHNVAVHEFIHLLDKMDGEIDGWPGAIIGRRHLISWGKLVTEKIEAINKGETDINPYGGTSRVEFFAVCCEYFFERPELMKKKHPKLYVYLEMFFEQNMAERKLLKHRKVKVGRNSPCPCQSGKKYKKCCGA